MHVFDKRVETLPSIQKDGVYARVYKHSTRASRVYRNLVHQFSVKATHLSDVFLEAFRQRHSQIASKTDDIFTQHEQQQRQIAFLVTIESPNGKDLEDHLFWTVRLQTGKTILEPIAIKKVRNKPKLELFFQGITPWSKEYLLVFKPTEIKDMRLMLGNSRAKVGLDF